MGDSSGITEGCGEPLAGKAEPDTSAVRIRRVSIIKREEQCRSEALSERSSAFSKIPYGASSRTSNIALAYLGRGCCGFLSRELQYMECRRKFF